MKNILLLVVLVLIMPINTMAAEEKTDILLKEIPFDAIYDSIPDRAKSDLEYLGENEVSIKSEAPVNFRKLFEKVKSYLFSGLNDLREYILFLFSLFLILLFISLFNLDEGTIKALDFGLTAAVILMFLNSHINIALDSCCVIRDTIRFMFSFIPVFCSLSMASGNVISANAIGGIILMFCQTAGQIIDKLFIPFLSGYMLLAISAVFSSSNFLEKMAKMTKSLIKLLLIFTAGFISFSLAFTNHMSSSADTVSAKASGLMYSTFIPVIGSVLKDAAGSFKGCMSIIKASAGSFGIIAGLIIFLPSLIKTALYYVILNIFAALLSAFKNNTLSKLLAYFKDSGELILATQFLVLFLTVVSIGTLIFSGYGG